MFGALAENSPVFLVRVHYEEAQLVALNRRGERDVPSAPDA
jgi:hypothetical protein